jgi:hypothetical protein
MEGFRRHVSHGHLGLELRRLQYFPHDVPHGRMWKSFLWIFSMRQIGDACFEA